MVLLQRHDRVIQQDIQQILVLFVNENHNDWDDHLPYLTSAYKATVQESTRCTPTRIMLGREILLPIDAMVESPIKHDNPLVLYFTQNGQKRPCSQHFNMHIKNLSVALKNKSVFIIEIQKVGILMQVLQSSVGILPSENKSQDKGRQVSFEILRKRSDLTYEIKDCKTRKTKIHVVHVDHLK